jgi:hypothetical protein
MLEFLRGKVSDRKLRLTLCSWSRLNWKWMPEQSRAAVEAAELFADGLSTNADREAADVRLWLASMPWPTNRRHWLARLTLVDKLDLWSAVGDQARCRNPRVMHKHAAAIRCIFGPLPFRSITVDPSWLTPTVKQLAHAIYEERAFDRLPVLDALEEVGCEQPDILSHLRGGGEHCRGCWVVDLVLGRE